MDRRGGMNSTHIEHSCTHFEHHAVNRVVNHRSKCGESCSEQEAKVMRVINTSHALAQRSKGESVTARDTLHSRATANGWRNRATRATNTGVDRDILRREETAKQSSAQHAARCTLYTSSVRCPVYKIHVTSLSVRLTPLCLNMRYHRANYHSPCLRCRSSRLTQARGAATPFVRPGKSGTQRPGNQCYNIAFCNTCS